jgi:hypothetical protein
MQKCPVYLYPTSFEVLLDLDDNYRVHNIMYQRELKIQKGLKNKVQIQFKNSDQKLLNVSTGTYVFSMFDALNQQQLIRKELTILDAGSTATTYPTKGLGLLELNESDTLDLDTGMYQFTVASVDSNGSYEPTYANTYYGVSGSIEIRQDSFPVLQPSTVVTNRQFEAGIQYNHDTLTWDFYSGNLRAHPEFNSNTALHTVAIYLNRFKGKLKIQGTLENNPGYFGNYADITDKTYTRTYNGIDYFNFNGVWSNIRIVFTPDKDMNTMNYYSPGSPNNPTPGSSYFPNGNIDKLLYRS